MYPPIERWVRDPSGASPLGSVLGQEGNGSRAAALLQGAALTAEIVASDELAQLRCGICAEQDGRTLAAAGGVDAVLITDEVRITPMQPETCQTVWVLCFTVVELVTHVHSPLPCPRAA
jgi:hypothetical protein